MKKIKLNNKGFMLVETLIVAVFSMAIFSIVYTNYYPIMAEYERREVFDDIDGKYGAYWMKKVIQEASVNFGDKNTEGTIAYDIHNSAGLGYHIFDCNTDIDTDGRLGADDVVDSGTIKMCNELVKKLDIVRRETSGVEVEKGSDLGKPCVYITTFNLTKFKSIAQVNEGSGIFTDNLADYVSYLPKYDKIVSLNRAKYRVIVEFHRTKDNNDYYAYSTIEVKK